MNTLQHPHARTPIALAVLAAGALALAGCGTPGASSSSGSASASAGAHAGHAMPSATASADFNSADAMFAQMMVPHHEQAVEMSEILLAKPGIDARVAALAQQIKAAQAPEIATLKGWLSSWGQPTDSGSGSGGTMSGMTKEGDLAQLRSADAAAASKLFLTQMIAHHEGAVQMARTEQETGRYPEAVAMAASIVASQSQEIDAMKSLLTQL